MRAPAKTIMNLRIIFPCMVLLGFTFFFLRSMLSSENGSSFGLLSSSSTPRYFSSNKLPDSLSSAILHYATTRITPQQSQAEISVTERVLRRKSPCNLLVFGLGYDSLMWASFNHGGRTVFLEEDEEWVRKIVGQFPTLEAYHVAYDTKLRDWEVLLAAARNSSECLKVVAPMESKCVLSSKILPKVVYTVEWDLTMVDAPKGFGDSPGRMAAIYTAGLMARNKDSGETDVFVHDVDRPVENAYTKEFLCEGYMVEQVGRLRHFTIPSHRTRPGSDRPFCPPTSSLA